MQFDFSELYSTFIMPFLQQFRTSGGDFNLTIPIPGVGNIMITIQPDPAALAQLTSKSPVLIANNNNNNITPIPTGINNNSRTTKETTATLPFGNLNQAFLPQRTSAIAPIKMPMQVINGDIITDGS